MGPEYFQQFQGGIEAGKIPAIGYQVISPIVTDLGASFEVNRHTIDTFTEKGLNEFLLVLNTAMPGALRSRVPLWISNSGIALNVLADVRKPDGALVGTSALWLANQDPAVKPEVANKYNIARLHSAAVLPEFRNMHLGRLMTLERFNALTERDLYLKLGKFPGYEVILQRYLDQDHAFAFSNYANFGHLWSTIELLKDCSTVKLADPEIGFDARTEIMIYPENQFRFTSVTGVEDINGGPVLRKSNNDVYLRGFDDQELAGITEDVFNLEDFLRKFPQSEIVDRRKAFQYPAIPMSKEVIAPFMAEANYTKICQIKEAVLQEETNRNPGKRSVIVLPQEEYFTLLFEIPYLRK